MEVISQQQQQQTLTVPVTKIGGLKSRAHVLEQITALRYQELNNKLVESGFDKIRRNFILLKKNNGDLETVLKILNEKMIKKALRLEKRKERELLGSERVKKTEKRSRSEKPLRRDKRGVKLADSIIPEDRIDLKLEEITKSGELAPKEKREKRIRKERCEKSEKAERRTKKEKKERPVREEIAKKYEEWPTTGVTKVFLDGNNMLFADKFLLKLRLKRQQRQAEEALSKLASNFASRIGNFHTVLVFDTIKIPTSKATIFSTEGGKVLEFETCEARPKYSTSDDALVEWMGSQSKSEECLVVTSDRGLQLRLKEKGVTHLMKTGNWFRLVKTVLGEEYTKIASEYSFASKEEEGTENEVAKKN